ncbi:MAG: CehA/McbA family metallohydrolase [Planctomycetaceae bacterium]
MNRLRLSLHCLLICAAFFTAAKNASPANAADGQLRASESDDELKSWLQNMVWHHRYSADELKQVTGLSDEQLTVKLKQFDISDATRPARPDDRLLVLPYPGGRHPRIGFLEGAIEPQRETKLSVFCPWDDHSYAVLDIPEAIWSNLGLTYLAHTHIDTIWSAQGIELEPLEWRRTDDGGFVMERRLPNGIVFGTQAVPAKDHVRMKMWLTNGTDKTLSDLRVQNCVMLKAADGFQQQDNDNKLFTRGYAIAHSPDKSRWTISGWDPVHRAWGNGPCPCLHSDPKFPDCEPGETKWLRGWFSFYEGNDIEAELDRIEGTGWKTASLQDVSGNVVGEVRDSDSDEVLPCRLYVQSLNDGSWHYATSASVAGSAVTYKRDLSPKPSVENHTALSADPFQLQLPPGRYRIRAERGKEYIPAEAEFEVTDDFSASNPATIDLELRQFIDMPSRGWYSGDIHVHRLMNEVPTAMLADDVHVAFPLNYWVRDSREIPSASGPPLEAKLQHVDATHVIWPVNTEYEIFSVDGKRHTQGAVFVINHTTPLNLPAPPVLPVAEEARRQGALLDLDKHSWNWSMMIVPLMNVDLFELTNNHHWRTTFGFPQWTTENAPTDWPEIERDDDGFTELGWTEFGLQTYYALLNCGFRMRVSGGTASGVHPVPLGYGRVYVHTGEDFDYQRWIRNLNAGNSFVTNGPLMDVRFNEDLPGTTWQMDHGDNTIRITGTIESAAPLKSIEVVRNGEIAGTMPLQPEHTPAFAYRYRLDAAVRVEGSGWLALRCFEDLPNEKIRFAHTNPVFVDVADQPLKPRRRDAEFFVQRMDEELRRNEGILSREALAEFAKAREIYARILSTAREE